MGFEPTRGDPNGLAVHRLNHSATSSTHKHDTCNTAQCQRTLELHNQYVNSEHLCNFRMTHVYFWTR